MLLFIYFNPIIGPDLLYSVPKNLTDYISEEDIDQIKRLMDAATPGFFSHAFSTEKNTANYFFMIPSAWARGKQEMVMISKIVEEEAPNYSSYEKEFKLFVQKLKEKRPSIYKALYTNNPPLNYETEIQTEFDFLINEIEELAKFFSISQAQTHGILMPFSEIRKTNTMQIPKKILRDLESFIGQKENYFIVFQRRKENFKIDVIPFEHDRIVKITVIFNGQLSPDTLKEIGKIFQEIKLPFVYTSGICQQGGDCIYEVYLDPLQTIDFDAVKERLRQIRNVDDIKIIEIDLAKVD